MASKWRRCDGCGRTWRMDKLTEITVEGEVKYFCEPCMKSRASK